LERGARVRILDAGISLEPARAAVVAQMCNTGHESWSNDEIAFIKAGTNGNAAGIPLKLAFGSDFPYRDCDQALRPMYDGVALRPSLARGGLSNVWGAAMLPYRQPDIADWPINISELDAHYAAVALMTGLSARHDDLEQFFPVYQTDPVGLELSRQATAVLERLGRNREQLARAGVHFGHSRLAVRVARREAPGCVYCGLCMYGCPYGHIYNAASTLEELRRHPNFSYQTDVVVTGLRESADRVLIEGHDRIARTSVEAHASRVYLATGAISTTQILLRSGALYDQPVTMKDSQYFLLPLLTKSCSDVRSERLHTLSQLFVEMLSADVSPYTVHLQLYSYNDLIAQAVRNMLGRLAQPFEFLARQVESRLIVVQGYLHSTHSGTITVTLKGTTPDQIQLKGVINPETRKVIRRVVRKLFRIAPQSGLIPVPAMMQIAEPGRGFHSGCSFPMARRPTAGQSDTLGRPHGWLRVHAVDASVLPSVPATTITFTAMANAHRIGQNSVGLQ
jgi:choline dehydrogenase-like flavoprotein